MVLDHCNAQTEPVLKSVWIVPGLTNTLITLGFLWLWQWSLTLKCHVGSKQNIYAGRYRRYQRRAFFFFWVEKRVLLSLLFSQVMLVLTKRNESKKFVIALNSMPFFFLFFCIDFCQFLQIGKTNNLKKSRLLNLSTKSFCHFCRTPKNYCIQRRNLSQ